MGLKHISRTACNRRSSQPRLVGVWRSSGADYIASKIQSLKWNFLVSFIPLYHPLAPAAPAAARAARAARAAAAAHARPHIIFRTSPARRGGERGPNRWRSPSVFPPSKANFLEKILPFLINCNLPPTPLGPQRKGRGVQVLGEERPKRTERIRKRKEKRKFWDGSSRLR